MYDDQLDFHSYCVRLMTLRSYVDTMRFEDQLRSQEAYFQAALQAIRVSFLDVISKLNQSPVGDLLDIDFFNLTFPPPQILARLHDDPSLKKSATKVEPDNCKSLIQLLLTTSNFI